MSGNCWESLPDVSEGWEAIPDIWQLLGGLPECPGGLADVREASRMSGSVWNALPVVGWKDLPDVREALLDVWEWSEAFHNVREWSGIYPRCPGGTTGYPVVVGWLFRMSGSGREALPDVQE